VKRSVFVSDLHFDNTLPMGEVESATRISNRLLDVETAFDAVAARAIALGADLRILGDVFNKRLVDAPSLLVASRALRRATAAGVPIKILPGNHDAHDVSGARYSVDGLGEIAGVDVWRDGVESAQVRGVPVTFARVAWKPDEAARASLNDLGKTAGGFRVALLHQNMAGCMIGSWACPEGFTTEDLAGWDVVISGHFHLTQEIRGPRVAGRFLGAPLQHNFGDVGQARGFWIADWEKLVAGDPSGLTFERIATVPEFGVVEFEVEAGELRESARSSGADGKPFVSAGNCLRVIVTGTEADIRGAAPQIEALAERVRDEWKPRAFEIGRAPRYSHRSRLVSATAPATAPDANGRRLSSREAVSHYLRSGLVDVGNLDRGALETAAVDLLSEVERPEAAAEVSA
jgi:hypothetical protein